MNKFSQIIEKTLNQLNEVNADGTDSGGYYNNQPSPTSPQAAGAASLHPDLVAALKKIQTNPSTPNLNANEAAAIQALSKNLKTTNNTESKPEEKDTENKSEKDTNSNTANSNGGQVQNTIVSSIP